MENSTGFASIEIEARDLRDLENEAGGHRIQRVPPTEKRGRVHTSTVTVSVIDPSEKLQDVSEDDFVVDWYSGSGSGGQHRNKHQNSCRITHKHTGIVRKHESRSRADSYAHAMDAVLRALREEQSQKKSQEVNGLRKSQIGTGMRGDKRRTYRFQEGRVVDHVTGKASSCGAVMNGEFNLLW